MFQCEMLFEKKKGKCAGLAATFTQNPAKQFLIHLLFSFFFTTQRRQTEKKLFIIIENYVLC